MAVNEPFVEKRFWLEHDGHPRVAVVFLTCWGFSPTSLPPGHKAPIESIDALIDVTRCPSFPDKHPLHHGSTGGGVQRARKGAVALKLDAPHRHLPQAHLRKHPVPRADAVRLQEMLLGLVAAVACVLGRLPGTHHHVAERHLVSLHADHGFLTPRFGRAESE